MADAAFILSFMRFGASIIVLAALVSVSAPSSAQAEGDALPCAEYGGHASVEGRLGNERNIAETSIFLPLACAEDRLLFGDIRYRQDNQDNLEGNVGIGVRSLQETGVLGGYVYFDRKRSFTDKLHSQVTVGGEWLTEAWEARANGYIPVTDDKVFSTGTPAGTVLSGPFLQGSGIFVNQAGQQVLRETPLYGGDIEGGIKILDSNLWLHMGAFRFDAEDVKPVSGARARATWNITENIAVFAEGQNDTVRGKQGWIGARLTVPFGGPAQKAGGLKARMTASPVRDIDIVTSGKVERVTADGVVPVINTESGAVQRVLYVDNTAAGGGDGSLENPFDTLAAAQAVLADYDTVYIARGDGTVTKQNTGLNISQRNVQVIGEGSAFVYNGARFTTQTGNNAASGTILKAAGLAPTITNTAGNGVTVTGDNALLSGFTVEGAATYGINALSNTGASQQSIKIENVAARNNVGVGIAVQSLNTGSSWNDVNISNVTTTGNAERGVYVLAQGGGDIGDVTLSNVTANNNTGVNGRGVDIMATGSGSTIANVAADDIKISANTSYGMLIQANSNGQINAANLSSITSTGNAERGVYALAQGGGDIGDVTLSNVTANNNTGVNGRGVDISAIGSGSTIANVAADDIKVSGNASFGIIAGGSALGKIDDLKFSNVVSTGNAERGVYVVAETGGDIGDAALSNITSNNNTGVNGRGVNITAIGSGSTITNVTATDITTNGNAAYGVLTYATGSGQIGTANLSGITSTGNGDRGVFVYANSDGDINNVSLSNVTSNNTSGTGRGVDITAIGSGSTIANVTADDIKVSGNASFGIIAAVATLGKIDDLKFSNVVSTGNVSVGAYVLAETGGNIGDAALSNITSNNNTGPSGSGVHTTASGVGSTIANVTATDITTNGNAVYGVLALANTSGQIGTANLAGITSTGNVNRGVFVYAQSDGDINNVSLSNVTSNNNTGVNGRGVHIWATDSGSTITNVTATDITTNGNAVHGVSAQASTSGQIGTANLSGITSTGNVSHGVLTYATNSGQIGTANLAGITSTGNASAGVYVLAETGGDIGDAALSNITSNNNTSVNGRGVNITATGSGSTIANVTATDITTNGNAVYGVLTQATGSGQIGTANLTGITSTGNGNRGVFVYANGDGDINNVSLSNVTSNNTSGPGRGVDISATGSGSTISNATVENITAMNNVIYGLYAGADAGGALSAKIQNSTFTGNVSRGVFVNDDTTGTFVVDLGGGALGSLGYNSIHSNTAGDILVDLDGGQLKAENNWWGVNTGLAGGKVQFEDGSSIDATPHLTSAP